MVEPDGRRYGVLRSTVNGGGALVNDGQSVGQPKAGESSRGLMSGWDKRLGATIVVEPWRKIPDRQPCKFHAT
jgi:hypothetical protein